MRTKLQKIRIYPIILLSLLMSFCTKDIKNPYLQLDKLYGKWKWIQSSGGITGLIETPAIMGYSQTIEFNKNGNFKLYKNNSVISSVNFTLSKGNSILSTEKEYLIKYQILGSSTNNSNLTNQSIEFGGQDSLFLYDECYDCFSYIYIREN